MNTAKKYGLGTVTAMMIIISTGLGLLMACDSQSRVPPVMDEFKQIKILETGIVNGRRYTMFVDPVSKARVFYYEGGMMMLPPEKSKVDAEASK